METDVQRVLEAFRDLRKEANVKACFGEPVTVEGRTVMPVARVGYALGLGAGKPSIPGAEKQGDAMQKADAGGGGGLGVTSSPLGVVEVTPRGTRVEPIIDRQRVAIVSMLVGAWSAFWLARALEAIFGRRE